MSGSGSKSSERPRPSQYELHASVLVALGRRLGTAEVSVLAAAFFDAEGSAPNLGAVEMASLILVGEGL